MAQHMSLESMLDEERKDVLALLEGTPAVRKRGSGSSGSGRASSPFTPRSPVRSMLDVDDAPPRAASIGAMPTGMSSLQYAGAVRSMLDINGSPPAVASTRSAQTSPTEVSHKAAMANNMQHRSLSDAASRPADFGPRAPGFEKPSPYQVSGYLTSNPGGPVVPKIPKRNTQGGRKITSAMAEVMSGGDISTFGSRDRGRNHSIAGTGISNTAKSRSPHNRLGLRSNSPQLNPNDDPTKFVLRDGRTLDMHNAYRRLSDANLALSGGGLSALSVKSRRRRANSDDPIGPDDERLEKDYTTAEGEDAVLESSDEDPGSSDDERQRGRKKEGREDSQESTTLGMGRAKGPRTASSLMAAAEEERLEIASQQTAKYKVRSLLEPEITVTSPMGDRLKPSKPGVHPNTSFDEMASGLNTPVDSDTEADLEDVKRAQKLSVNMTKIMSTPATSRCVQTIYRGDFVKMQEEARDNQRRVRKYLVATDLSDEAAHALEWTIGTVLRDGDTLLAIYCVDEEVGIAANDDSATESQMKEQAQAVASSTKPSLSTPILAPAPSPSPLGPGFKLDTHSASASPAGRERGKAEQERYRAVQDISERVTKLLRKTKLQVKVVIEVIHCKSPKHLITEVIDYISPTLVILGSRGRSALKGVILGSFSNYLVTKSSVPVMVARKRLRKHTKYKRPSIKLANNLKTPVKSLASAKID